MNLIKTYVGQFSAFLISKIIRTAPKNLNTVQLFHTFNYFHEHFPNSCAQLLLFTIKCTTSKLQTKIIEGSYGDELTGIVTLTIWPNIQSAETA
jgi:hypothetical protein